MKRREFLSVLSALPLVATPLSLLSKEEITSKNFDGEEEGIYLYSRPSRVISGDLMYKIMEKHEMPRVSDLDAKYKYEKISWFDMKPGMWVIMVRYSHHLKRITQIIDFQVANNPYYGDVSGTLHFSNNNIWTYEFHNVPKVDMKNDTLVYQTLENEILDNVHHAFKNVGVNFDAFDLIGSGLKP